MEKMSPKNDCLQPWQHKNLMFKLQEQEKDKISHQNVGGTLCINFSHYMGKKGHCLRG
jgi:hypothetical protein